MTLQTLRRSARLSSSTTKISAARENSSRVFVVVDKESSQPNSGRKRKASTKKLEGLTRIYEDKMMDMGFKLVAGVDEAGRGPLAGPVVAAACVIPPHVTIEGIDDSKKIAENERERLYELIISNEDIMWSVSCIEVETIDRINILQATMLAMEQAVHGLGKKSELAILVDGNRLPKSFDEKRSRAIVKGDSKCISIAAASILAKVTRDRIMVNELDKLYPQYNFKQHKGYAVPEHYDAIKKHGPCPAHRRTFAPVRVWFPLEGQETLSKKRPSARMTKGRSSKKGKI